MSKYYFNEKKGIYEPIDEAPLGARFRSSARGGDDLAREIAEAERKAAQEYDFTQDDNKRVDIEQMIRQQAQQQQRANQAGQTAAQSAKRKKGGLGSLIFFGWLVYMLVRSEACSGFREFFNGF